MRLHRLAASKVVIQTHTATLKEAACSSETSVSLYFNAEDGSRNVFRNVGVRLPTA
jgi:hypothetical protein